jgi:hypothetical protein
MMSSETTIGFATGFGLLMLEPRFLREVAMPIDKDGGCAAAAVLRRSALAPGLPKQVCLRGCGALSGGSIPSRDRVYEFEVVTGNAAWREGERFYLTPAQAERAYFSTGRTDG